MPDVEGPPRADPLKAAVAAPLAIRGRLFDVRLIDSVTATGDNPNEGPPTVADGTRSGKGCQSPSVRELPEGL